MATFSVFVKHQGKKYEVEVDPTCNGEMFKSQLYSLTGVEPHRQKVLVKHGQLKDNVEMGQLGLKPGHTLMMMGTPAGDVASALKRPTHEIKFLEDMSEAEVASRQEAIPAGLLNLGNTCYLNAALQTLRSIPELLQVLVKYKSNDGSEPIQLTSGVSVFASMDLVGNLRDLFHQMSQTQRGYSPIIFLNVFRRIFPDFAQTTQDGGFAQQDAEEAWSQIVTVLREKLEVNVKNEDGKTQKVSWIDRYMSVTLDCVMECAEPDAKAKGEEPIHSQSTLFKLNCHITAETNFLRSGIVNSLSEKMEKWSDALEREAIFNKTSRIVRLPKYLPVHFLRFNWRRSTGKKAKIMRKVVFPMELDVVEFCSEKLQAELIPIRDKLREIRKDEEEVLRNRARQKRLKDEIDMGFRRESKTEGLKGVGESSSKSGRSGNEQNNTKGSDEGVAEENFKTDEELEAEKIAMIKKAKKELHELIRRKKLLARTSDGAHDAQGGCSTSESGQIVCADEEDDGQNHTGLYELRAVITHQGASADSGHYTAFIKKSSCPDGQANSLDKDSEWWWFNDDRVSLVNAEKIESLAGGGNSHSALVLLYRAVPVLAIDEVESEPVKNSENGQVVANEKSTTTTDKENVKAESGPSQS